MKKILLGLIAFLFTSAQAETITFRSDRMTGSTKKNGEKTTLSGNAQVETETMELFADSIELSGPDYRFITATGSVKGKLNESQMDFSCGTLTYDRTTKLATLKDSVHLLDIQNNVEAEAEIIEYNQNTEIAVLQISILLKQKDNTCTAAYAIYRKKEQTLTLTGNPTVQQGDDMFRAQEIELNLDTNEIALDGRVRGTVSTKESTPPPQSADTGKKKTQTEEKEEVQ
ncbi:MAG TPA: organic solvent tolerance protein OstA [Treponema sp.]|nr:organic solvent tolerance protein OstA [Treponema sp.]HBB43359.1 organic solvent tolerance protein OstA [Treponema sp.]HCA19917.1 organic solvent tolerance protein OstA [Treponema sp.]